MTLFTIVTNITYLGVILTKLMKNLYDNNFKPLGKKSKSLEMERSLMLRDWQD